MTARGTLLLADAGATAAFGAAMAATIAPGDVIALSGTLGSGKTTLARGLLAALGLAEEAPSPSFPIVIAYAPPDVRVPLWHVDLYRIALRDELDELGLDDARAHAALVIEWPDRLPPAFLADALAIALVDDPGGRRLTWSAPAAWERRWPPLLRR